MADAATAADLLTLSVLNASRGQRARAEPFDAVELQVGCFGDDEEDVGATCQYGFPAASIGTPEVH